MRAKRSFFNAFSGLFSQFVSVALGVIIPRLVLVQLGSEANGLLSATQQALVYLDLLESGIGTAALQALYKPAAEQDRAAVSGIFNAIRREYAKVDIAYAALVCGLSVLFPFFIKTELSFLPYCSRFCSAAWDKLCAFCFRQNTACFCRQRAEDTCSSTPTCF